MASQRPAKALPNLSCHERAMQCHRQELDRSGRASFTLARRWSEMVLPAQGAVQQRGDFAIVRDSLGQRLRALFAKLCLHCHKWDANQRANVLLEPMGGFGN